MSQEFSDIDTAPEDPRHVQQVIDHIAHLEDEQVDAIRDELNRWKAAAPPWPSAGLRFGDGSAGTIAELVRVPDAIAYAEAGREVFRISNSGEVKLGDGIEVGEASAAFWRSVGRVAPVEGRQVLRARNGRLTRLLRVARVRWSNRSSS